MRQDLRFTASQSAGEVSAILERPPDARCLLVLGHGAGAGMTHAFMETTSMLLAERDVATWRYQFPYMEKGSRRPDYAPILLKSVASAIAAARAAAPDLPLFVGGKSMGGRMSSQPGTSRGDHLQDVTTPMLFLQGTRDKLADLDLLRPVCDGLGERATLHVVEGGDHSFKVLKRSGRDEDEVLRELADTAATWMLARTVSS